MNDDKFKLQLQSLINQWRAGSDEYKILSDKFVGAPAEYFNGKALASTRCADELQDWLDNVFPQIIERVGEKYDDER